MEGIGNSDDGKERGITMEEEINKEGRKRCKKGREKKEQIKSREIRERRASRKEEKTYK